MSEYNIIVINWAVSS